MPGGLPSTALSSAYSTAKPVLRLSRLSLSLYACQTQPVNGYVRQFAFAKTQLAAAKGAEAKGVEDFIGQLAGVWQGNGHVCFLSLILYGVLGERLNPSIY